MLIKRFSLAALLIVSVLIFSSCSDEPVDSVLAAQLAEYNSSNQVSTGGGSTSSVVGTYLLTAFNTSIPTDLNGDGTASTNQMSETSCFNNSLFVLNSNNTFTATG